MKIEYRVVSIVDTKTAYPDTTKIYGWRNTGEHFSRLQDAEQWIINGGETHVEYTIIKVFIPLIISGVAD